MVHMLSVVCAVAGVAMLVVAALHDVAARMMSHRLMFGIGGAGLMAQLLAASAEPTAVGAMASVGLSILAAACVFFLFLAMWRFGLMGGGDVKLLTAAALLVPATVVPALVAAVALAGGPLSLIYLLARRRVPAPPPGRPHNLIARVLRAERRRLRRGGPVPYAVAIACGAMFIVIKGGVP